MEHYTVNNLKKIKNEVQLRNKNITIIAVSKTFTEEKILPLIDHGQKHFGDIRLKWACIDDGMLPLLISMPMFGTIHTACDENFAWQPKFRTALVLGPGAEGCRRHLDREIGK